MKEIAWYSRAAEIEPPKDFRHNGMMLRDGPTAAQRLAIRKLIRAKSDREIARLLRKSYYLLNLHRRRSNVSHRERWADYEIRLVGRIRDEELAKLLRRTTTAVAAMRESLHLPIFMHQRIHRSKPRSNCSAKGPIQWWRECWGSPVMWCS
jgi:hypothetical protein